MCKNDYSVIEYSCVLNPELKDFDVWQESLRGTFKSKIVDDDYSGLKETQTAFENFVLDFAHWKSFLTLTFREPISVDAAHKKLKSLIRLLNRNVFGKNYPRCVGHSYFSYCVGMEFQKRDVIHFHLLIDKPIDFSLIHKWWNLAAGFAYIEKINERVRVCNYVCKYVLKGGEVWLYSSKSELMPRQRMPWWTS